MSWKSVTLLTIALMLLFAGCAKRNTAYQDGSVLSLERQIPIVGNALDLSFDDNHIFVAQDQGGISIINKSNYATRWLTSISATDGSNVTLYKMRKIAVVGQYNRMFLNETDGTDKIHIIDISDLDTLRVIDAITGATTDVQDLMCNPIANPTDGNIIEVSYCAGRNLHHGRYNGQLWLGSAFSIYPPATATGMDMNATHVFVSAQQRGLFIYTRDTQQMVSAIAVPGEAQKVKVVGNYAYIASRQGGFHIVDVSNPAAPVLKGGYNTTGYATTVDVSGNLAVVSSGSGGVYVFDISNPNAPKLLERLTSAGYTNNAKFNNGRLIVASRDNGVLVYTIDTPGS